MPCLHSSPTQREVHGEPPSSSPCVTTSSQQPTPSQNRFVNVQKLLFVKLYSFIKIQLKHCQVCHVNSRFLTKVCIETHNSMSCLHSSTTQADVHDESDCSSPCLSPSQQQPSPNAIRFVNVHKVLIVKLHSFIKIQLKHCELGNVKSRFLPNVCIETHNSMSCLHSSTTQADVHDESDCSSPCLAPSQQHQRPSVIRFVNGQKVLFVKLHSFIKMQLKHCELGNVKSRFLPNVCIDTHNSMSCLHSSTTQADVHDESDCSSPCLAPSQQDPRPSAIRFVNIQKVLLVKLHSFIKIQLKHSVLGKFNSRFLPKVCIEAQKSMSCLHSFSTQGDVQTESACSSPCVTPSEQQQFLVPGRAGTLEQQTTSTPINIRFVELSLFVN
jgi:hypothetical protein